MNNPHIDRNRSYNGQFDTPQQDSNDIMPWKCPYYCDTSIWARELGLFMEPVRGILDSSAVVTPSLSQAVNWRLASIFCIMNVVIDAYETRVLVALIGVIRSFMFWMSSLRNWKDYLNHEYSVLSDLWNSLFSRRRAMCSFCQIAGMFRRWSKVFCWV